MKLVVIPERVKDLRIGRALTQARLAEAAGVDEKTVRFAETGVHVSLTTISKLAQALDVKPSDIASKVVE